MLSSWLGDHKAATVLFFSRKWTCRTKASEEMRDPEETDDKGGLRMRIEETVRAEPQRIIGAVVRWNIATKKGAHAT